MGTSPAPSSSAIGAPNRKPRDSIETTRVIRASRYGSAISVTACANSSTSSSTGVTSLNTIPGFGKLLTSRIVRFSSATTFVLSDVKGPRDLQLRWNLKSGDVVDPRVRRPVPQVLLQHLK